MQEILSPIYFIIVIVVLVLVVPTPFYPEVSDPGGQGDVFSPPPFMSNFRWGSNILCNLELKCCLELSN